MTTKRPEQAMRKACWSTYYQLGVELNKRMHGVMTFEQIGRALGMTKQNAYTECVLALGKLAYHTRERVFGRSNSQTTDRRK